MSKSSQEREVAVIPKGTRVKIHGCPFELTQNSEVFATQDDVDNMLRIQQDWESQPKTGLSSSALP